MNLQVTSDFLDWKNKAKNVSEEQYLNAKIFVFWDLENCLPRKKSDVALISNNINLALERQNYKGPVSISAYGNVKVVKEFQQQQLTDSGIKLIHIPPGRKDATDKHMMVDMALWAKDNSVPANIMLISGDGDFLLTLFDLYWKGFNLLLAEPIQTNVNLRDACSIIWKWETLREGGAPYLVKPIVSRQIGRSYVEEHLGKGKEKMDEGDSGD
ncbi:uncharacterized protein [Henckelia pumila]|uniref:uncharacterized protein n=1 Tax=Henckelia pumila TaxID=405737 RepID=UPI003C6DE38D